MKIVGLLSWYDESASWLSAAVNGFARLCDTIIAVDGAYMLYPSGRNVSHPDQAEAITLACEAQETGLILHRPETVWFGNEVEKRNHTLKLASTICDEGDWLCVFDADYHIMRLLPDQVRAELEQTDLNVASYTLLDNKDLLADSKVADIAVQMDLSTEWTSRTRDLYRWTPDLEYGPAHFTIRGTYQGVREWIRGPETLTVNQQVGPPVASHHLDASMVAYHRTHQRAAVRRDAAWEYYRLRDSLNIEDLNGQVAT